MNKMNVLNLSNSLIDTTQSNFTSLEFMPVVTSIDFTCPQFENMLPNIMLLDDIHDAEDTSPNPSNSGIVIWDCVALG